MNGSDDVAICVYNQLEKVYYCLECVNPIVTDYQPDECPHCGARFVKVIGGNDVRSKRRG